MHFRAPNVAKDPPFSKLDLITCRNVLIYLGHTLQAKVMRLFHYALKPAGFLVLGASETIGEAGDIFSPVDRQHKVYARKQAPAHITTDFGAHEVPEAHLVERHPNPDGAMEHEKVIDRLILARYAPPAVVIDANLRVLQFRGDTSAYLRHAPGSTDRNLAKLARGNLGAEIRKLTRAPGARNGPVKSESVTLTVEGVKRKITMSLLPVPGAAAPEFVVVFEVPAGKTEGRSLERLPAGKGSALLERARDLEDELASTKKYLHSVIEEQEAFSEELKSAHEEVQSSNEELQSTNEELLTAKEELQSTNEELTTVNDEMHSRNAELQQINNDLVNLLSSVNIPIVMLGNDLRVRRFTPQAERILNLLPSDTGRSVSDFRLKINVPDLLELCRQVIDSLVPREREVQDHEGNFYSMWLRPYRTADNRIDGVVLALFDVTERKQAAAARDRHLFEESREGIVIADAATGEILDSNPSVTRMFGYPRARLTGAKFWESELLRNSELGESIRADLHEGESVQKSLMLRAESGEQVPVDVSASLCAEPDRKVIQLNIRDASARKRLQDQLHRDAEQLRHSERMEAVGRLAAGVAHDFNNVLTAIVGYADLLRRHLASDQPAIEILSQVRSGAERAVALTRQMMAFGRKQVLNPEVLEVNAVVTEMQQMLFVMMPANVELEFNLEGDAGSVRADRTQLEQIVLNLALNARDAMPDGGMVTVATSNVVVDRAFAGSHPTVPAGNFVAITVQDGGTGMDEQTQAHMFEPFFTTKARGRGTGLGLSTVQGIVKESGGHLWAYSALGVGTTFTVYLPKVEPEAPLAEGAAPALEQAGGTETILLVEDERAVRDLARRLLELHGYRVLEATGGQEALRIAREHRAPIHLMVTDVGLPRISGREIAFRLASERPDMKVLYVSGHADDAIAQHGVLEDGLAFLEKPFTERTLVVKVRQILDQEPAPRPDQKRVQNSTERP